MVSLDPKTLGHCELKGKLLCYTYVIQQNFSPHGSKEIESGVRKRQLPQDKAQ